MAGIPLGPDTVTVRRPWRTVPDEYGNQVPDWHNAADTILTGCMVQPLAGDEQLPTGRDAIATVWQLFAPGGPDTLRATDRVVYRGVVHEVDGEVSVWLTPWGSPNHVQCRLKVVRG